jgi:DNA primase
LSRSFLDSAFVDEVRARTDIVELVGEYVALRQRGRNHTGLCPFHTEKTPSFTVSAEKQMFHCFGCGAGGDVFSFLQRKEGLSFPDSVRRLAERVGIRVPERALTPEEAAQRAQRDRLRQVLELAAAQYQRWLWSDAGSGALAYMRKRQFDDATLRQFGIGWAPPAWDGLVQGMKGRGVDPALLVKAGLAGEAEGSRRIYDRFRGRVMFPIWDPRGRVIAFGGRVLPAAGGGEAAAVAPAAQGDQDAGPKYLNSPETELFVKGHGLYALHLARGSIRERGQAIIVEGYVDAITCHRAGFTNVVASLGTALTASQGRLLLSMAREILVAYDADTAGQAATIRGLEILAALGGDVRVVSLPGGKDPDDCIRGEGSEAFAAAIARAEDYLDYRFRVTLSAAESRYGAGSVRSAAATAAAVAPALAALASAVAREAYIQRFARALGVSEASFLAEVRRAARSGRPGGQWQAGISGPRGSRQAGARGEAGTAAGGAGPGTSAGASGSGHIDGPRRDNIGNTGQGLLLGNVCQRAEEQLIAIALRHPRLAVSLSRRLRPDEIPDEPYRQVLEALAQAAAAVSGTEAAVDGDTSAAAGDGAPGDESRGHRLHGELLRMLGEQGMQEAASLVARLALAETIGEQDWEPCERIAQDCIRVLQEHSTGNRIIEVRQEVQRLEREGRPVPSRMLEELMRLQRSVKGGGAQGE